MILIFDLIFFEKNHVKDQDHSQIELQSSLVTLSLFFSNSEKYIQGLSVLPYYKESRILAQLRVFVYSWKWKIKQPVTEGGCQFLAISRYRVRDQKCRDVGGGSSFFKIFSPMLMI